MKPFTLKNCLSLVAGALVILIVTTTVLVINGWNYQATFTPAAWQAAKHPVSTSNNDTRADMLKDLLAQHLKPGTAYVDVINLLGTPDAEEREPGKRFLTYLLGRPFIFKAPFLSPIRNIDDETMIIELDRSDKAISFNIYP